jgi:hypothetical protein
MKNKNPSDKTLEIEANIRSMMSELNVVNIIFPIVCFLTALFYVYRPSHTTNPQYVLEGLEQAALSMFLLWGSLGVWFVTGWVYLLLIRSSMKDLPRERRSTMWAVITHLQPTIYLFLVFNLILVYFIGAKL